MHLAVLLMLALASQIVGQAIALALRPDPRLTVWEWADEYRILSGKSCPEPGKWRTSRTPYLREIMECLSPSSPVERVVFMAGTQVGKTECGNNWIGYTIHQCPAAMMAVQPTTEMAKRLSKQRIDSLIEESPVLRSLVKNPRARDSGNTIFSKEFPGGILVLTGANSDVGLRSMPVKNLFLDEVDAEGYGAGRDAIGLATARTENFPNRKIFITSNPGIEGLSNVARIFEKSDRRRYWVPCPDCGEFQFLKFAQLRWPKGKAAAGVYVCEHCGAEIRNHQKTEMLAQGEWRTDPSDEYDGKTAGFHLSRLYAPHGWHGSWPEIAEEWEAAQKDQSLLQTFVNKVLAETWKQTGEAPEWQRLYERAESCKLRDVPAGGLFLTAGADVQKDRIEVQVVAWGRGKESWLVDYIVLDGDPSHSAVWGKLDQLLNSTYRGGKTDFSIIRLGIDTGYATQEVYNWVRRQGPGRVLALDPREGGSAPIGQPSAVDVNYGGRKIKRGMKVWPVATGMLKSELYGWLRLEKPTLESGEPFPLGYCHFPQMDEEFFKQLTAEVLTARVVKGYRKHEWVKVRERNEALDTRVYARAAASQFGLDRYADSERWWQQLETAVAHYVEPKKVVPLPAASQPLPASKGTSWLGDRGKDWFRQ